MPQLEAREGAAGVRIRIRGALPARYGANRSPSVPGAQVAASASSVEWSAPSTARSQAAEPAALSITPIACHVCGTAWQKTWTRASGSGA